MTQERQMSENVTLALRVLGGEDQSPEEAKDLANKLKAEQRFSFARRILGRARTKHIVNESLRLKLAQQHALCTYKDPDIMRSVALDEAWTILSQATDVGEPGDKEQVKETLGIAGAIFKRRFELTNQKRHLEKSLHFYLRGHISNHSDRDFGYTGINAAFVLDYLAHIEEAAIPDSSTAKERRAQAKDIRLELLTRIPEEVKAEQNSGSNYDPEREWWLPVTFAEAHLGLGNYGKAEKCLATAMELPNVSDWEKESTVRQLARLAWLHTDSENSESVDKFADALLPLAADPQNPGHAKLVSRSMLHGRIGLALSGGGFRASFFHIGVLARLAELDLLRQVEVLSCVSGGSIVGAQYYLELQKLLANTEDTNLAQEDYVIVVRKVASDFLAGVQRNIRTRVVANLWDNLKMVVGLKSRTVRAGELFEKELFAKVDGVQERCMSDLMFKPAGWPADHNFNPNRDNWQRVNKVPTLILNATSLNTGHNWQFTASWMGEPPEAVSPDIDVNERLRRMYYDQAPETHQNLRLGQAVAASACVPGLFEPVSLPNLYQRRRAGDTGHGQALYSVELVDGGVHDNQGASALLGQNCDVVMVSDASGQSQTILKPNDSILSVLMRSNSILMKRVRTAQFDDLKARERSGQLRGLMLVHLKCDLDPDPEDWIDCEDPWEARDDARAAHRRGPVTRYGILRSVQHRLASIRTDLDSFTDVEAHALMLSGYRMTVDAFKGHGGGVGDLPGAANERDDWIFLSLKDEATTPGSSPEKTRLHELLEVGAQRFFKIWKLSSFLRCISVLLMLLLFAGVFLLAVGPWSLELLSTRSLAWIGLFAALGLVVGKRVARWLERAKDIRATMWKFGVGVTATIAGWVAANLHLNFFDTRFRQLGSQIPKQPAADPDHPVGGN